MCKSQRLTFVINESAAQRLTVHRRSPISFCYAISLNADWAGPTGKHTMWKFERSPRTYLGSQAVFACPLNLFCSHSARWLMEGIGGVIIEMLNLCRRLDNYDCMPLTSYTWIWRIQLWFEIKLTIWFSSRSSGVRKNTSKYLWSWAIAFKSPISWYVQT